MPSTTSLMLQFSIRLACAGGAGGATAAGVEVAAGFAAAGCSEGAACRVLDVLAK
jgi:hypothetical protein